MRKSATSSQQEPSHRRTAATRRLSAFRRDERGVIAVLFGLLAVPAVVLTGGSLDYARANRVSTILQGSLDAGALAAAGSLTGTEDEIRSLATSAARESFKQAFGGDGDLDIDVVIDENGKITLDGTYDVDTQFLGLIAMNTIAVKRQAVSQRPTNTIEVAVSADVSGSMRNQMDALKKGLSVMFDEMEGAQTYADVKVALVPYNHTVRVGTQYRDAEWLDQNGRSSIHSRIFSEEANRFDVLDQMGAEWEGCVVARPYPHDVNATRVSPSDGDTYFVPWFAPDEAGAKAQGKYKGGDSYYNTYLDDDGGACGAVGTASDDDADVINASSNNGNGRKTGHFKTGKGADQERVCKYDGAEPSDAWVWDRSRFGIGPNLNCPKYNDLVPLTADIDGLRDAAKDLTAGGNTDLITGFMWSWHNLTPYEPFDDAAKPARDVNKYIVLMTDGENTYMSKSPDGGDGINESGYSSYEYLAFGDLGRNLRASDGGKVNAAMNERFLEACANAKASGINVYTIGFRLDKMRRSERERSQNLLTACANSASMFIEANSEELLADAFRQIAEEIAEVRLLR